MSYEIDGLTEAYTRVFVIADTSAHLDVHVT